MKITIAPLFSRIPSFIKGRVSLFFPLCVFIAIFILSYYYLSKVDKIQQKKIEILVNGEEASGGYEIGQLKISLGINAIQLKESGFEYGHLGVSIKAPDNIDTSTYSNLWYEQYGKKIYYMSTIGVKSNFKLPKVNYVKDNLGIYTYESTIAKPEYADLVELTDKCVIIKQLHINDPGFAFPFEFRGDIVNTSEAPWYNPVDISTICFSMKINRGEELKINDFSFTILYSGPLNIISIYPEPDEINSERIMYRDSSKLQRILNYADGFYILAQDLDRLHENNMKNFWSATILGACISIIAEIIFRMGESRGRKKRQKKQYKLLSDK